jgi:hypothetical protein
MKTDVKMCVLICAVVCLATGLGRGQQPGASDNSLGDLARKVRAEKSKEAKPAKVITNDNILSPGPESGVPVPATTADQNPSEKKPEKPGGEAVTESKETGDIHPTPDAGQVHDEKYYRARMSELQASLDLHKRELSVLEQKLDLNQTQYYNDPQKALEQQYSRDDINKRTQDIDAKKQQIADDEKAIDDLRDQLNRESGDPGWLR